MLKRNKLASSFLGYHVYLCAGVCALAKSEGSCHDPIWTRDGFLRGQSSRHYRR